MSAKNKGLLHNLNGYTAEEIEWAKHCINTQRTSVIGFLIEMRRTTEKRKAADAARDLTSNRLKGNLVRLHNERHGHAERPAKEVIADAFADALATRGDFENAGGRD